MWCIQPRRRVLGKDRPLFYRAREQSREIFLDKENEVRIFAVRAAADLLAQPEVGPGAANVFGFRVGRGSGPVPPDAA
jgi:hypothetical protein